MNYEFMITDIQTYIKSKPFDRNAVYIEISSEKGLDFIFGV